MPPHQLIEQRLAVRSWAHDLSVQDGGAAREILSYRSGQRLERLKRMPVARYESAGSGLDVRDGAESIQLRLKDPVWVIEWPVEARQRHRTDSGEGHLIQA